MGGGGVENHRKLRDVIYGRPLISTGKNTVKPVFNDITLSYN
jgi:hypothetical protein